MGYSRLGGAGSIRDRAGAAWCRVEPDGMDRSRRSARPRPMRQLSRAHLVPPRLLRGSSESGTVARISRLVARNEPRSPPREGRLRDSIRVSAGSKTSSSMSSGSGSPDRTVDMRVRRASPERPTRFAPNGCSGGRQCHPPDGWHRDSGLAAGAALLRPSCTAACAGHSAITRCATGATALPRRQSAPDHARRREHGGRSRRFWGSIGASVVR